MFALFAHLLKPPNAVGLQLTEPTTSHQSGNQLWPLKPDDSIYCLQ